MQFQVSLFLQYLLKTYYILGIVLGSWDKAVNKAKSLILGSLHSRKRRKTINKYVGNMSGDDEYHTNQKQGRKQWVAADGSYGL